MIPEEKIEEVRDRASIVDVVSDYVRLKKQGRNFMGLCPFHSEKTPSFSVNEDKRLYHCFGCNESGNVITFLMKKEGLEFPDAVRSLASRYGVTIEEKKSPGKSKRDRLYRANSAASKYFFEKLREECGLGARRYLVKRGYRDARELVREFGVGYAPDSWDGLCKFLKKNGIPLEDAEKAGVVSRKKDRFYDRFRGRLIFPITDSRGRTVAFGGRALASDARGPKYLNSPETDVFKKSDVLYGFYQAKKSIMDSESVLVAEGYFDLLALHKAGFTNSVATMGTALTESHLRLLKGYALTVYALFDQDAAGKNAAVRSLKLFLGQDLPCRVVVLPSGKDPDDFLASKGAEALKAQISSAGTLMDFCLDDLAERFDTTRPEGKARFLDKAVEYLRAVSNPAERDHYAVKVASRLGIQPASVYEALKTPGRRPSELAGARTAKGAKAPPLRELTVLRVVLAHPELYTPRVGEAVELFVDPAVKRSAEAVSRALELGETLDAPALVDSLDDAEARTLLTELLVKEEEDFIESPEKMLSDSLEKVFQRGRAREETLREIERLEQAGLKDMAEALRERLRTSSGKTA